MNQLGTWHCLICGTRGGGGDPAWTRHYIAEHIRDRYDDEGDAEPERETT